MKGCLSLPLLPILVIYALLLPLLERFFVWLYSSSLKDKDSRVRLLGVRQLSDLRSPHAFNRLIEVYKNEEHTRVRSAALHGILLINPDWLPDIPGIEILEESIHQLAKLLHQSTNGNKFVSQGTDVEHVKEVGEKLNAHGGQDLMVLALLQFSMQHPEAAMSLQSVWEIGWIVDSTEFPTRNVHSN